MLFVDVVNKHMPNCDHSSSLQHDRQLYSYDVFVARQTMVTACTHTLRKRYRLRTRPHRRSPHHLCRSHATASRTTSNINAKTLTRPASDGWGPAAASAAVSTAASTAAAVA